MKIVLAVMLGLLISCGSSPSLVGNWKGDVSVMGMTMSVVYKIKKNEDGTYDLKFDNAAQGMLNQPVDGLSYENGVLSFAIMSIGADYEGRLSEDGKQLIGKVGFRDQLIPVTLTLQEQ